MAAKNKYNKYCGCQVTNHIYSENNFQVILMYPNIFFSASRVFFQVIIKCDADATWTHIYIFFSKWVFHLPRRKIIRTVRK